MSVGETLGAGMTGNARVVVTEKPGPEGTFAQFVYPTDLGKKFTTSGIRFMVVQTERGLGGLDLNGAFKNHVIVFKGTVLVTDVTPAE